MTPRNPDTNWRASNGTLWWIEVSDADDETIVYSFRGGPELMRFQRYVAPLELAAFQEILTLTEWTGR